MGRRTLEDRSMASLEKRREYVTLSQKNGVCWREECGRTVIAKQKKESENSLTQLVLRFLIYALTGSKFLISFPFGRGSHTKKPSIVYCT